MNQTANRSGCPLDQGVLETLMVPLAVLVRDELLHGSPEMPFSKRNEAIETLLVDRPDEPLRIRIGVSRQLHRRRVVRYKPFELRIPSIRCVGASSN
jgi:hypothetical protein